jgi:DNA-binding transcriptional ArsR family regulator
LTRDKTLTYYQRMDDDELVFKALADSTRRLLLDRLFARDGQTLADLLDGIELTRFGVMRHLGVLEEAGLITTKKAGRWKLHYLNSVPIRQIHDRWIGKYTERGASALVELKRELEDER